MSPPWLSVLTEGIKISRTWREEGGRWRKERRLWAPAVLWGANQFFRLAGTPVRAVVSTVEWQLWEVASYHGLHGAEGFQAEPVGHRSVRQDALPGVPLTKALDDGTLTPAMCAAAGRELSRAHAWQEWSHGDCHAGNFIYDATTDRARLLDFDLRHGTAVPTRWRQEDDVLAFLQDLLGRITPAAWVPCARAFLQGYGAPPPSLHPPGPGLAQLWWRVRCGFRPMPEIRARLEALRRALQLP